MEIIRIYFSATGKTFSLLDAMTHTMIQTLEISGVHDVCLNDKAVRNIPFKVSRESLLLVATPVYAGRVPNILSKFFKSLNVEGAKTIAFVTYGNRAYDDALKELSESLVRAGARLIGAGAFIAQHSFSNILGAGRPDLADLKVFDTFTEAVLKKLNAFEQDESFSPLLIPGNEPIGPYYTPKDSDGNALVFKDIIPEIERELCVKCGKCVAVCPMQSLKLTDQIIVEGACIKCCACVKACPTQAIAFKDRRFIAHLKALEYFFIERKEPIWFM